MVNKPLDYCDMSSLDALPNRWKSKNYSCLVDIQFYKSSAPILLCSAPPVCATTSYQEDFSFVCIALILFSSFSFLFVINQLLTPFSLKEIQESRVMLCFPRKVRHFLYYSPVNFQALHRNWTKINHPSISSGTSPEVGIFVELEIAIINKKSPPFPLTGLSEHLWKQLSAAERHNFGKQNLLKASAGVLY